MGVDLERRTSVKPDYETDPRPFSACIKEFGLLVNGGSSYRSRMRAAEELRVAGKTLAGWMDGRPCSHEAMVRRLMSLIVASL